MFTKGRPRSIVPIDFKLANGLSVVPELPTPQAQVHLTTGLYNTTRARPVSQVTEIDVDEFASDEELGEDSEEAINLQFVSIALHKEGS
jgi:hypothetical protein